jgi:hypothetical protein
MLTTRAMSLLFSCVLLITTTGVSQSYVYQGSPNCPWNSPTHTWKDFFLGKYGDQPRFTVRFDHLTHNIGTIPAGSRYTVVRTNGAWGAGGPKVGGGNNYAAYSNGDPAQYQLSVWGALFGYNEGGQVYWNKELVGTLRCGIGSDA